jgi:spore maturation protein CgeB
MKILLLWTFYDGYLEGFYRARPGLDRLPHARQLELLLDDGFGWPPAVARYLAQSGNAVEVVVANCEPLQRAWAHEHDVTFGGDWRQSVPTAQVRRFRPDILWTGSNFEYFGEFMRGVRDACGRIVAWTAAPLPVRLDLSGVDCMVTSHENFAAEFRARGLRCERMLPCFDPRQVELAGRPERDVAIGFVGSLSWAHMDRIRLLDEVAEAGELQVWCSRPNPFSRSALRPAFWRAFWSARKVLARARGEVYGREMYHVLARTRCTVNVHIGVACGLAGNMRMFEATGMGSLLFTEAMRNLADLFDPATEVIAYRDGAELRRQLEHFLARPEEAAQVAARGQRRTLRDYSAPARAVALERLFEDLLGASAKPARVAQ